MAASAATSRSFLHKKKLPLNRAAFSLFFLQKDHFQVVAFRKCRNRFEILRQRKFLNDRVAFICFFKGGINKAFELLHAKGAAVCRGNNDTLVSSDGDRFLQQVFIILGRAEGAFFVRAKEGGSRIIRSKRKSFLQHMKNS